MSSKVRWRPWKLDRWSFSREISLVIHTQNKSRSLIFLLFGRPLPHTEGRVRRSYYNIFVRRLSRELSFWKWGALGKSKMGCMQIFPFNLFGFRMSLKLVLCAESLPGSFSFIGALLYCRSCSFIWSDVVSSIVFLFFMIPIEWVTLAFFRMCRLLYVVPFFLYNNIFLYTYRNKFLCKPSSKWFDCLKKNHNNNSESISVFF